MAHSTVIDFRYQWLSQTIANALGISNTVFADQLIAEHSDLIDAFFNDDVIEQSNLCKQILYVWRIFYDKLVEETISVLEEGIHPNRTYQTYFFFNCFSWSFSCSTKLDTRNGQKKGQIKR